MSKITFKVEGGEDVIIFAAGCDESGRSVENVLELAHRAGVAVDAPCSGNGTCGKCRVKVLEGTLSSEFERRLDGKETEGWVLACSSKVVGDAVVFVPLTGIDRGDIDRGTVLLSNNLDRGTVPETACDYGVAIDVGTTSVSALLVDLSSGDALVSATTGNAQVRFGADVINRIIQQQKPGGIKRLQETIVKETILPLIDNLCTTAGISSDKITRLTVAANTTMNHLLLGVDANSIRIEPYSPAFLEFEPYNPASIGIKVAPDAKMILAPNVGSYVGGDITAGVSAAVVGMNSNGGFDRRTVPVSTMSKRPEMTLFIDLGTNGEIVFGNNEFLMACACSAGPAFEGGEISCGMRAMDGAIEACIIDKDTLEPHLSVIGETKPAGLCGSGLIDVVAELFRTGIINGKGKFQTQGDGIGSYVLVYAEDSAVNRDITITETDIDNFIRAKGAIFSGIMSLLSPLGFSSSDIDDVLIAGGIGSGINIKNAISIGMLPALPEEKYSYIGNSSLNGAYKMLISQEAAEEVIEIARNMTYIDLSTQPGYMDEFVAACFLPHTNETLFPTFK